MKVVLMVEAHPDDGILGCGGTVAKIIRKNPRVILLNAYFIPCLEDPKNKGNLEEHQKSLKILGIQNIYAGTMARDGYVENNKQECRNILYNLREKYIPDLVLCPTPHDFHQDHATISECCQTIFRDTSTILGYEVLRSVRPTFQPTLFVDLACSDWNKKMAALEVWKSQFGYRKFFNKEKFNAHMRMRGTQSNTEFAEAFEVLWAKL